MTNKQENFKRISNNRKNKILTLFSQLKNLKNSSFYQYSNDDINKLFEEIEKELVETKKVLLESNHKSCKSNKVEL